MKPRTPASPDSGRSKLDRAFAVLFGAFLGLALLKFPNAAILESQVASPTGGWEWALNPWPVGIGQVLLILLALGGIGLARWRTGGPRWLLMLPAAWLVWQFLAATQTVDPGLTNATLKHFAACTVCFYLGYLVVGQTEHRLAFLGGLVGALALVIAVGFEQHFGGLERTRTYFFTEIYPHWKNVPADYVKRISSNRIWATLFYPNSLAGALLLLLPIAVAMSLQHFNRLTLGARQFVAVVFALGGLACLFWSGSKGGWLLMLMLGWIALLRAPLDKRLKQISLAVVLAGGLAGFGLKYAGFFQKGATSVSARFDYWQAASRTAVAHPVFGTGPGTFAIPYAKVKHPESEMARLVHNDFLQQASDSGWVGCLTLSAFVVGALFWSFPRPANSDWLEFVVWLGLLGWWLQGLLEFGLYIPALAWNGFALMGWLLAQRGKRLDNPDVGK